MVLLKVGDEIPVYRMPNIPILLRFPANEDLDGFVAWERVVVVFWIKAGIIVDGRDVRASFLVRIYTYFIAGRGFPMTTTLRAAE